LETLQIKLAAAFAAKGSLVMLVGEAGIGKTAIAQKFAVEARQRGAAVLWGACFEGEWRPPYGPWVEALGDYVRSLQPERLRRHLGVGAPPLARLVPHIRALLPQIPSPVALNPNEERFRLYEALTQFLLSLAEEQPVALILDDLHWADSDSLEALRYAARFAYRGRLLLVGIYREPEAGTDRRHPLNETVGALWREAGYERLLVAGLSRREVADYLAQAAGQALPQALAQTIHAETNGNPFYVRQLFHHLVEEAKIVRREGRWATDFSMAELGIPAGARQVVARRLARLSDNANTLLRFAAAFTGGFHFQILQTLTGLAEETLLDALDEALQTGLIESRPGLPARYDFVHAIVRHTLYDELNPDRRARLHRRIAQALEQAQAGQGQDYSPELAFQYHASAGLPGAERGIPFCLAAAEQAQAGYAHEQAVTFLRMARDLAALSPAAGRADIACRLAMAEAQALLLADAQRSAQTALTVLAESGATAGIMTEFLAVMARVLKEGGADSIVWQPLVERGLALAGDLRNLTWARLMLLLDRVEPISTDFIYVSRWLGYEPEAVALAQIHGDEDDYARALEPLDWRNRAETESVLALARSWQRPTAMLRALDVVARDYIYRHGDIPQAAALLQELLVAGRRYGSIPAQAEALMQLVVCQALLGELAAAQSAFPQAQEMAARLGPTHRLRALALTAAESVLADYLEGDWPRLAQEAARFATDPQAGRGPLGLIAANFATHNYSRAGNVAEARRFLAALTSILERAAPTVYLYNGAVDRGATTVWELNAVEFADIYRRLALNLLAAGYQGAPLCTNALTVARMATLLGDMGEAEVYFAHARRDIEASSQRPLRAIADYDEALALNRAGASGRARIESLLDSALAQFRALGMAGWEQRALALLAQPAPPPPQTGYPAGLTAREVEVLRLIAAGRTNKEIAAALVISLATAERHIANIYNKIGARNRAEATAYALNQGLVRGRDSADTQAREVG
jgi:DNA-binding CsgD family transcriptional regulator